jgi:hypothetical protein
VVKSKKDKNVEREIKQMSRKYKLAMEICKRMMSLKVEKLYTKVKQNIISSAVERKEVVTQSRL